MTGESAMNTLQGPGQPPDAAGRTQAILVSHTHWDREWYLTVEQLRPRLVRLFRNLQQILRDEVEYDSFWLDGQTAPLEDFWETVGDRPGWLEEALRGRKILAGPWFTLPDEWLASGEALIRNLFAGQRLMRAYGQENRIGYLPDSFGHVSQMPAILAGFGIENAFFFRGLPPGALPGVEFVWLAPSGQRVLGIELAQGYFNAQRIDAERHLAGPDAGPLGDAVRELLAKSRAGVVLLMNGVDQALPTHGLARSIERLNELLPAVQVQHGSLAAYAGLVNERLAEGNDLPAWHGEMLHAPGLDGTLSARAEQKIANRLVENLLIYTVEPLLALLPAGSRPAYAGALRRAWRLVLQCHAHDSICGCHSDLVAADMMSRFEQARQLAEKLEEELLVELTGIRPAEQPVVVPEHPAGAQPTALATPGNGRGHRAGAGGHRPGPAGLRARWRGYPCGDRRLRRDLPLDGAVLWQGSEQGTRYPALPGSRATCRPGRGVRQGHRAPGRPAAPAERRTMPGRTDAG